MGSMKSKDEEIKLLKKKIKELKNKITYIIVPDESLTSIKIKANTVWMPYWEYYPFSDFSGLPMDSYQFNYTMGEKE